MENEDALHNDHRCRLDENGLVSAVVIRVGVHRAADGVPVLQLPELLHHQVGVEGVGMVIVLLAALGKGDILPLIVIVMVYHADVCAEVGGQVLRQGGFAAAGAAGDADDHGLHGR